MTAAETAARTAAKLLRSAERLRQLVGLNAPYAIIRNEADIILAATGAKRLKPSAIGRVLLIAPHPGGSQWAVLSFSEAGNFQAASVGFATARAAGAHRAMLLRHHKRLAAERAARSAKRKGNGHAG